MDDISWPPCEMGNALEDEDAEEGLLSVGKQTCECQYFHRQLAPSDQGYGNQIKLPILALDYTFTKLARSVTEQIHEWMIELPDGLMGETPKREKVAFGAMAGCVAAL